MPHAFAAGDVGAPSPALAPAGEASPPTPGLGRQLRGDLPCVVCKYNLKGISIRDKCPECGTAVRATILRMVDPYATELQPILAPRLVAAGLITWAVFSLLAIVLAWAPYVFGMLGQTWRVSVLLSASLSGIGAMAIVRPHRAIHRAQTFMAALGVAMYIPIVAIVWQLTSPKWYVEAWRYPPVAIGPVNEPPRAALRLALGAAIALALLLLRPNARLFVARSLALRTGRVDRQTMLAMVGAVCVAGLGDLLELAARVPNGNMADALSLVATILVALGSALLTLGAAGVLIDACRIARAIIIPTPSLSKIIGDDR